VGNIHATIGGSLHGSKHLGASARGLDSNVEVSTEGLSLVLIDTLNVELLGVATGLVSNFHTVCVEDIDGTVNLLHTRIHLVKTELRKKTTGTQETGSIGSGEVLEASLEAVARQLSRGRGTQDPVTGDLGGDHLDLHVLVGETDYESVLGGLVLVLVLGDELMAGSIVGVTGCSIE
jgi:hypothetical protein